MAQYLSFMEDMNVYSENDPMMVALPSSPSPRSAPVMPDSIKKSYQQQFLPIRQQSLPYYQQPSPSSSSPSPLPTPIRKSSISATTRPRRKMKESSPVQSAKQSRRKISAGHRSSKSETNLVMKFKNSSTRQRRYSLGVPKKQEEQDFLNYYYHQFSPPPEQEPISSYYRSCISIILTRLLEYNRRHQKSNFSGHEIVVSLFFIYF
ncbi:hypothetical protein BCR42DRAFT_400058 [Absidia repens]|uniref:Uncharacterized protein n=1 Tax=Absidia repens TaxID=90262 RepID=A0A1X2J0S0_9FUNG|nr:hypothetical protein BCR42DRAFT_400058 [Absidia repens]